MPNRACHGVASLNSVYYNRFPVLFTWSVFIECLTYTRLRFFFLKKEYNSFPERVCNLGDQQTSGEL